MDKEKIEIENIFTDLSECTEYYYDELSKLSDARDSNFLKRNEAKALHNNIMFFFNSSLKTLKSKMKANNKVDKTEINDFKSDYKKEHKSLSNKLLKLPLNTFKTIKQWFKNKNHHVELISEEQVQKIEQSTSIEETMNSNVNSEECNSLEESKNSSSSAPKGNQDDVLEF